MQSPTKAVYKIRRSAFRFLITGNKVPHLLRGYECSRLPVRGQRPRGLGLSVQLLLLESLGPLPGGREVQGSWAVRSRTRRCESEMATRGRRELTDGWALLLIPGRWSSEGTCRTWGAVLGWGAPWAMSTSAGVGGKHRVRFSDSWKK